MESSMAAVVQYGPQAGEVEVRDVPVPELADGTVLLRVAAVGVCGTDVHQLYHTRKSSAGLPVTLGHEFAGTIAMVGSDANGSDSVVFREGDRVVSETAESICGACAYCRAGHYNVCPHRRGFGFRANGAMAAYVRVPVRCLHHVPDGLDIGVAALAEPCCVAYNAVIERSAVKPGDSVLVLGPGPIGLLSLAMARLSGADTTVVAGLSSDAARLGMARDLGATYTVDLQSQDIREMVRGIGDGYGVDLVIDASGSSRALGTAMDAVRPMGQITKVGWGPEPLDISLDPIVAKAATLSGSFSHTYQTWERVIGLLSARALDTAPLVGLRVPLNEWRDGFEAMHQGRVVKSVLYP
ncbi:MAG: zinc-binding dehydrogenase [Chloroflexia bacterium]|nr:zinc-binding dehydrogenase [Chloroflexia bacterium]